MMKKRVSKADAHNLKQDFWAFSKRLFQQKESEDIWICLEQKYELNLNIIACCCFLSLLGFPPLAKEDIRFLIDRITSWRDKVVEPLRMFYQTAHYQKKNKAIAKLSELVMQNEVLAEQVEQSLLIQIVSRLQGREELPSSAANRALGNIFEYINYQKIFLHNNDFEKIYRLVNACLS